VGVEGILEVSLVEDISFRILDDEDDAALMDGRGLGVGFEGKAETGC
jgi:hypothetical protein